MNFRILKKDLKRKKSINFILLIFICLSTMFITSSVNNMSVIMNGTDNFFEVAGISDQIIVTMGGDAQNESESDKRVREFLENQKNVEEFYIDEELWIAQNNIELKSGEEISVASSILVSSFNIHQQKFFDVNDKEVTSMEDGTIYLSQKSMNGNDIKEGDIIVLTDGEGYSKEFKVVGSIKDAFLGSELMGQERFIISDNDFLKMRDGANFEYGKMYTVWCSDIEAYQKEYNEEGLSVVFFCDKDLVKTTYIIEVVIAIVILMVSFCLIIIAILMLRFTIVFTISEDYKEIGILKAIGLKNTSIRRLYIIKYMVITIVGAFFGCICGIPFGSLMLNRAMQSMVITQKSGNMMLNVALSIVVVLLVMLCAYFSTRRIKKMTPMDAIRSGNNGERFKKKSVIKLQGSRKKATTFMAINDIFNEFKKYIILLITSVIGVWLVIMPVNTVNTLMSDNALPWFGMLKCDMFVNEVDKITEVLSKADKEEYYEYLDQIEKKLNENGIETERVFTEILLRVKIRYGDTSYQSFAVQGINTSTSEYVYMEGTAPVKNNEVAITHVIADILGANIGDIVYINTVGEEKPFVVTAIYQSMNNLGEGIRFTEDCEVDYSQTGGSFGVQVELKDSSEDNISKSLEKAKEVFEDREVKSVKENLDSMLGGVAEQIDSMNGLVLVIVISIIVLVVVLMQKIFLAKEKGQIAMLKAIGFGNRALYIWQIKRIGIVLMLGMVIGTLTSTGFCKLTAGQVFKIMGVTNIEFNINPLEVYVIYPSILVVMTLLACALSVRKIGKISVQEVNEIE